jgi:hypothetical protein
MELTTPALLFSTISLLMLAYTNRFLAIAKLIRDLHDKYLNTHSQHILSQIKNLRLRLNLIRNMQLLGVLSLLLSVVCMIVLFSQNEYWAKILFGASMAMMVVSLALSVWEITISAQALKIELQDIEEKSSSFLEKIFKKEEKS